MNTQEKMIARLEYLAEMLGKYKGSWKGELSSERMKKWFFEYAQFTNATEGSEMHGAYITYCKKHNYFIGHTASDCLA